MGKVLISVQEGGLVFTDNSLVFTGILLECVNSRFPYLLIILWYGIPVICISKLGRNERIHRV